jgi:hypothetical protein
MMVCGKYSQTSEDTLRLSIGLLYACVVCARFCEMMRPICSNLAYYGPHGSYPCPTCSLATGTWTCSRLPGHVPFE